MKLISSPTALAVLLALTQRAEGARLAELAKAVAAPLSGVQTAVKLLIADRLIERDQGPRPRYRLRADHPAQHALSELATKYSSETDALDIVFRSNPAVEFAARDRDGFIVVEGPLASPGDVARLDKAVARVAGDERIRVDRFDHHQAVDSFPDDPALHARVVRATIIKGRLARSFPTRSSALRTRPRHRGARRPFRLTSRRALAQIARAHGLRRIRLFGSAARGDARPDSDVDVLVEPRDRAALSLLDLVRIEADLEQLLDRHVDVVTTGSLRDEVRDALEREAVALYG